MKIVRYSSGEFNKIFNRYIWQKKKVRDRVSKIIEDIRHFGDEAIIKYTKKLDKVKLSVKELKVSEQEISAAYQNINSSFIANLKNIIENITRFYKRSLRRNFRIKDEDGIMLSQKFSPLEKIGIYIPAGSNPLVSTIYMTVIPAKIAGVERIVLTTPPNREGRVNPYILVVASLLKVREIFKIGGAQAIAALALGTKTVPKVDKIFGPGNAYVTEAKRQLFGYVGIDMLAGPTELVIIANRFSQTDFIVADLIAQTEHKGGLGILITTSKSLAKQIRKQIPSGYIILAKNLDQAVEITNHIAPEHLEILIKNPKRLLKKIKNAAAIFLGPFSPVVIGDYVAGPSHVLPTQGTAKFSSGLNLEDFMKSSHIISYSRKALEKVKTQIEMIANVEGLNKHYESIKVRFS